MVGRRTVIDLRKPKGYRGIDHETRGVDLLAMRAALRSMTSTDSVPDRILGDTAMKRLGEVEANGWYPVDWLLQMMDSIEARIGRFGLLKVGRMLFQHASEQEPEPSLVSGREVIHGMDALYRKANRGEDIGGWSVRQFDGARAVLEKNTPHHCTMEEGVLAQALKSVGCPSTVLQSECFRDGAESCVYVIEPSSHTDAWLGTQS